MSRAIKLTPSDCKLYFTLHFSLLFFVNEKRTIIKRNDIQTPEQLRMKGVMKEKMKIRDVLYKNTSLIDDFLKENPYQFSNEELAIIASWKQFIRGKFYILQYLAHHAVFLSDETQAKAYGVKALLNDFEEVIGPELPILVEAILLPFKDQIVYDGAIAGYPVMFGAGIRRDLHNTYQEAKATYGLITSLVTLPQKMKPSDEDTLKFYLKNERNREYYTDEMWKLIGKDPKLIYIYHQEMGKAYARTFGKQLRAIGITHGWLATLQGLIVACGSSEKEVKNILQNIVPKERIPHVYLFQVK